MIPSIFTDENASCRGSKHCCGIFEIMSFSSSTESEENNLKSILIYLDIDCMLQLLFSTFHCSLNGIIKVGIPNKTHYSPNSKL